jgi:hypothetical protein
MANSLALLDAVDSSNLPASKKSAIANFFEGRISPRARAGFTRAKAHVGAGGTALLSGAVSGLVGGGLGYAHAKLEQGLDIPAGQHHVPLDGLVAAVGLGGFVLMPGEEFSATLCRAGATAFGILAFRKTHDWAHAQAGNAPAAGAHVSGDPVGDVANLLGIR